MAENTNPYLNPAIPTSINTIGVGNGSQRGNYTPRAYSGMDQSFNSLLGGGNPYSGLTTNSQSNSGLLSDFTGQGNEAIDSRASVIDGFNSDALGGGGSMLGGLGQLTPNDVMGGIGFGMNAYNMVQNWDYQDSMLGLAQNADLRSAEQWGIAKEEMGRIARVGENIQAGYNQGGNYQQQAAANPSRRESEYIDV